MGKSPHGHRKGPGNSPEINAQHWIDGQWVTGNPALMNIWSHAIWMGAAVFDGARANLTGLQLVGLMTGALAEDALASVQ